MKVFLTAVTICLLFWGCKKKDRNEDQVPVIPPVQGTILSLSSVQATPGDYLQVKLNQKTTDKIVDIVSSSITLKGYAMGDSSYIFIVPVLPAGVLSLSIPSIKNANTLSLTVSNYTTIANPQKVIDEFIEKRNLLIDSIIKSRPYYNFQASPESIAQLMQIKEEWDIQMSKLPQSDKYLIAYVLQKNMPDTSFFSFASYPLSHYAREMDDADDLGNKLVAEAKIYITKMITCVTTIPVLLISGSVFLSAPNPVSALLFLGVFTTYVIAKECAAIKAGEVGGLKYVGDALSNVSAQKIMTTEFANNTEKDISISVNFRNLSSRDTGLNHDISSAFSAERNFVKDDKTVRDIYYQLTSLFTKLKAVFPEYSLIIGYKPTGSMTIVMNGAHIAVKGVSDNRISFTSSLSGSTRKVKITSKATEPINFNITIAYVRSLDGKELTKDIPCTFKPEGTDSLTIISGNNQSAPPTYSLKDPLTVEVKDKNGAIKSGVNVFWKVMAGGGKILLETTTTDSKGRSTNGWQVGENGSQLVSASVKKLDGTEVSGSPVTFVATVSSELLDTMSILINNGPWLSVEGTRSGGLVLEDGSIEQTTFQLGVHEIGLDTNFQYCPSPGTIAAQELVSFSFDDNFEATWSDMQSYHCPPSTSEQNFYEFKTSFKWLLLADQKIIRYIATTDDGRADLNIGEYFDFHIISFSPTLMELSAVYPKNVGFINVKLRATN